MPKLNKHFVLIVTAIGLAFLWWYSNEEHRDDPPNELVTSAPPPEYTPEQNGLLNESLETVQKDESIDDAAIVPQDGLEVMGRVINQQGQNIIGMHIEISLGNSPAWQQKVYTSSTDHRGEFRFAAIPPDDDYRLEVLASGAYTGALLKPFPVNLDMSPLTITLESLELVTVDGMIVDVDDTPVVDFEILFQNVGIAYPGRKIASDSSGFFQLDQFPAGELQLSTTGDEHFNIVGITLLPDQYRNLSIAIDKGRYYLAGWVSDELGAPVSQARVVLTSKFSREDYHSSSYRFKVTDSNGAFSFAELGGQGHQLTVEAIGYETQVTDYQFQSYSDNLTIRLKRN